MCIIKNKTISVTGAGTAGCFTALYLAKRFPENKIIWVVESLTNNIGVGEATVPVVQEFLTELGYDVNYILDNCNGSLKLGIKFENFSKHNFWHPFGNDISEQQDILYMSQKNRIPSNIFDYEDIATHFDVSMLIRDFYNKIKALDNVTIVKQYQECDINIMCTGFDKNDTGNFVPASNLLNKQAYIYRGKYNDVNQREPYSICTGADNGWIWKLSLGDTVSHGYVNDGSDNCLEEFEQYLLKKDLQPDMNNIRTIKFKCGRKDRHILVKDKIKCHVGLSSCFLEPLESTGMYFIVNSIKMLGLFLNGDISADQYNDEINRDFDTVYNFIVAHYTKSTNTNKYWTTCSTMNYNRSTNNLFPDSSWKYILDGLDKGTPDALPVENFKSLSRGKSYTDWYNGIFV